MTSFTHKTTRTPVLRRLAATAVALGSCLALTCPAEGAAAAPPTYPVPTVFFGDSYTANFGIAPFHQDGNRILCLQAEENYPTVATRLLADKGITLDVQADVSCGAAQVHHFWEQQDLLGTGTMVPPQQDALKPDTQLVVGSMGGNTLGFTSILKQCSEKLREQGTLLPGNPVDTNVPAADCGEFFDSGDGKQWLDNQFEHVEGELTEMFDRIGYYAPYAKPVLVGYPRLVPADTLKCLTPAPGQTELPFADIPKNALHVLDKIEKRLNDVMKQAAAGAEGGADFVDLYAKTGNNTACDGANRGIGGLFEQSQISGTPWYAHPNEKGRDIQAEQVTDKIEKILKQ